MQTLPRIETERLSLRGFTVADCEPLSAFHSNAAKFKSHQSDCFSPPKFVGTDLHKISEEF
ncbi:MAG: hypothetical protein ACSHYC_16120 [Alphaproteobacteria bacterium]